MSLKSVFYGLCSLTGINTVLRFSHRRNLLVLNYHGVVKDPKPKEQFSRYVNTVSAQEFDAQLAYLSQHYQVLSLDQVQEHFRSQQPLPERSALITFDDGYRNNHDLAAPILMRHNMPAVIFLSTSYIGSNRLLWPDEIGLRVQSHPDPAQLPLPPGLEAAAGHATGSSSVSSLIRLIRNRCKHLPNAQRLKYMDTLRQHTAPVDTSVDEELYGFMSWDQVRHLLDCGISFGSHTVAHPILSSLDPQTLAEELTSSKARIESELGRECYSIAYPNGSENDYNDEVMRTAEAAGYRLAFTVADDFASLTEPPLAISRIGIPGHLPLSNFQARIAGVTRLIAGLRGS